MSTPNRIPSLDGLRALSIAFVLLGHLSGTAGFPIPTPTVSGRYSEFGVRVFFVISGFLITTLLLKEHEKFGKIDLVAFYRRRLYRIFPAAYAYIGIISLLAWSSLSDTSIIQAITYTSNYSTKKPWLFGHLWSLSVEEQFYLLWPAVLILFFRHRLSITIGTVVVAPLLRFASLSLGYDRVGEYFPTVADALAIGCLLAIIKPLLDKHFHLFTPFRMAMVAIVTLTIPYFANRTKIFVLGASILQVGIALCIYYSVKRGFALLNGRLIAWIGTLSYSLYLWQQAFLNRHILSSWTAFPVNLGLALAAACASYYLIEKPFLALGHKHTAKVQSVKAAAAAGAS
jgi:peptidoglycan/LPS O-acetylase OafA/YrhL